MSSSEGRCAVIQPLLSSYVDGETTATEAALVEEHLRDCAACASQFAFLRAAEMAFVSSRDVFPPVELFERVARATYAKPTLGERIAGFLRPAPVRLGFAAALAAGIVAAVTIPLTVSFHARSAATVAQAGPVVKQSPFKPVTPTGSGGGGHEVRIAKNTVPAPINPSGTAKREDAASASVRSTVRDKTGGNTVVAGLAHLKRPSRESRVAANFPTASGAAQVKRREIQVAIQKLPVVKLPTPSERTAYAVLLPNRHLRQRLSLDRSRAASVSAALDPRHLSPVTTSEPGAIVPIRPESHLLAGPAHVYGVEKSGGAAYEVATAPQTIKTSLAGAGTGHAGRSFEIPSAARGGDTIARSEMVGLVSAPLK